MTIRDMDGYIASLWDWGILNGCFGTAPIAATDVDGLIERRGLFLVIETKRPLAHIPQGQAILQKNLVKLEKFTVLNVWGYQNEPVQMQIITKDQVGQPLPCNIVAFRRVVTAWYELANRYQAPTFAQLEAARGTGC